jgi:hypothetical protein
MKGRVKYFIMQGLIPEAYEGAPHIGGNDLTTRQERIKRWKATESRLPREDGIQRVKRQHRVASSGGPIGRLTEFCRSGFLRRRCNIDAHECAYVA